MHEIKQRMIRDKAADPEEIKRYQELAVPWSEQIKYTRGNLVLKAGSFQEWANEHIRWLGLDKIEPSHWTAMDARKAGIKVGRGSFYLRHYPFGGMQQVSLYIFDLGSPQWGKNWLPIIRAARQVGRATFDGDVYIPILTKDSHFSPWMSLTPGEILSQRTGLRKAKGRVFMAGLGLAWLARRVAEKKSVKHLTVCELDPEIAQQFGQPLLQHFPDKVTLITGDAWKHLGIPCSEHLAREMGQTAEFPLLKDYDTIIFDIWDGANDAAWDMRWELIQPRHPNAWAWGYTSNRYD